MIKAALRKLVEGQDLTREEATDVMSVIMEGEATNAQIGALLAALRIKRETPEELSGFATAMRAKSVRVCPKRRPLVDTCGTGGDALDTFNISTTTAFVIAAAGVAVAKHGNRAVSSKCGSADVLGALGVELDITPDDVGECVDTVGVGFLFAPHHHPAMKHAGPARAELGIRTVFNVLGPLTNPAGAMRQLIGVFAPDLCSRLAETLARLGCERAMVVHGLDGMDEISTLGPTCISHVVDGRVTTETLMPSDFGVDRVRPEDVCGADTAKESADLVRAVLNGEKGARRDIVCVNAAAGLIVGGVAQDWACGVAQAREMIDTGRAARVLDELITFTQARKRQI